MAEGDIESEWAAEFQSILQTSIKEKPVKRKRTNKFAVHKKIDAIESITTSESTAKKSRRTNLKNYLTKLSTAVPNNPEITDKPRVLKPFANKNKKPEVNKAKDKLQSAKFRYLNERLYKYTGAEALQLFRKSPHDFTIYHDGFKNQVSKWPVNPLELIIAELKKESTSLKIADFGCGDAGLYKALSTQHEVRSFDVVANNEFVTVCDMAHTPLKPSSVHVVVCCLSLMGVNIKDYVCEANRVLKNEGELKIAEVTSRFNSNILDDFLQKLTFFGFKLLNKDTTNSHFVLFNFKKVKACNKNLPKIELAPCLYKKR